MIHLSVACVGNLKAALFCHLAAKKVACDDIENSTACTNFLPDANGFH